MVAFTLAHFLEPGSFLALSEPPIGLMLRGMLALQLLKPVRYSCLQVRQHADLRRRQTNEM